MSFRTRLCQVHLPLTELTIDPDSVSLTEWKRQPSVGMSCFPVIEHGPRGTSGRRGGTAKTPRRASRCLAGFSTRRVIPRVTCSRNRRTRLHLHAPRILEYYEIHRVSLHEFKGGARISLLPPQLARGTENSQTVNLNHRTKTSNGEGRKWPVFMGFKLNVFELDFFSLAHV